jgi:hypothetical protein
MNTHQRRVRNEMSVDVDFSSVMKMKKKPFMTNQKNKQKGINLLEQSWRWSMALTL